METQISNLQTELRDVQERIKAEQEELGDDGTAEEDAPEAETGGIVAEVCSETWMYDSLTPELNTKFLIAHVMKTFP
jgi:hypothetical protein